MRAFFAVAILSTSFAWTNPENLSVISGEVSFSSVPQLLEVTASDRAILEWSRFSIGPEETVRFLQPSSQAIALNRVVWGGLTEIFGTLESNGILYLINPRGVLVGENACIDTAAFLASTLDISNSDFAAGKDLIWQGESSAAIVQLGTVRARAGDILIFAHQIEQKGSLQASQGSVSLIAGHEILLKPKSCPLLNLRPDLRALKIESGGEIEALNAYLQADSLSVAALDQRGKISLVQESGRILLSSSGGSLHVGPEAKCEAPGGHVSIELADRGEVSKPFYHLGHIEASGGSIRINAPKFSNAGILKAAEIDIQVGDTLIETSAAETEAKGISVFAPCFFSSSSYDAQGGTVHLLGHQITLAGARISASGTERGGEILIGGDFQGKNPLIPNAEKVLLTHSTTVVADGPEQGGRIIVWSDRTTENFASLSASGAIGGFIEVSGKRELIQRGTVSATGCNGQVLFDPQSITIDSVNGTFPSYDLTDPNAGSGSGFGAIVAVLSNGNIVVTKPNDNFAASAAGAVYLYNGTTGALISTVTGSSANDTIGFTGVTTLTGNANYVIRSAVWDNGAVTNVGAATWGSGTTGVSGTISAANSLIGSTASDNVGSTGSTGVIALTNGNYVVRSPNWDRVDGGAVVNVGAATWGDGTTGVSGTVSVTNSLIGSTASDTVSTTGLTALTNGNYVVRSQQWNRVDPSALTDVGAVTWGNGTTGITGTVSVTNSLIGSANLDGVGNRGVDALTNGNYVVRSTIWNSSLTDVGAATWGNGTTGITGTVSVTNSLIGSTNSDGVGTAFIVLTNGNYVVLSSNWDRVVGGTLVNVGAATWGNGTTGITGTVSITNSLIGSTASDNVGGGGAFLAALTNGNYVVQSPNWDRVDGGAVANVGAVTWGDGTTGITGTVSITNSLIGSTASDNVSGGFGIALTNGNYVVQSPNWDRVVGGAVADVGAATWGNGTTGITGTVSITNSLIGFTASDNVSGGGSNGAALTNGNYVVLSPNWDRVDGGAVVNVGAATWGNGTTGTTGTVSVTNSLIGFTTNDFVSGTASGSVTSLTNGNYVVISSIWNRVDGGAVSAVGAVTWGNGTTGITGTVSVTNSLIGSTANDRVGLGEGGFFGATALASGNYIVSSPLWNRVDPTALTDSGAATWGNGTIGITGTVSQTNSVIGTTASSTLQPPVDNTAEEGTFVCQFTAEEAVRVGFDGPNALTYVRVPDQSMTIVPSFLTDTLNAGTNVTLQANNDITLASTLAYSTGNLSLGAGRSVLLNANITTGGANLTVIGNDTLADGVQNSSRSAGTATITIAAGVSINGGGGSLSLSLLNGAGKTNATSGDIEFGANSTLFTSGSGTITLLAQDHSISFAAGTDLHTVNGSLLARAGENITASTSAFSTTGTGVMTFVVDNLNPASPNVGSGIFSIASATFTSAQTVLFYATTTTAANVFPAIINGAAFSSSNFVFSTYYSAGTASGAVTVFYKAPGAAVTANTAAVTANTAAVAANTLARARVKFARAMAESFEIWNNQLFGPYLSDDPWAPLWTPKRLNLILPPLIVIEED